MSEAKTERAKKKSILAAIWDSMTKTGGCCGSAGNCCGSATPVAAKEDATARQVRRESDREDQRR